MFAPHLNLDNYHVETGYTNQNRFVLLDLRMNNNLPFKSLQTLAMNFCESPMVDDLIVLKSSIVADARMQIIGGDGRLTSA